MSTFTAVFERNNVPQQYTKVFTAPSLEDATVQAMEWSEERDEYFAQIEQD